ncbi:probable methyltransferase PMT26 [Ananas comosus]|uniref:Probable methyltransferase PMT26 n=1 Tax=Ananas comosus TaxID=4615 RepID=A0A6P5GX34_ANACO|nr:probable methyltransferase PMT26 [Ananas comosus]
MAGFGRSSRGGKRSFPSSSSSSSSSSSYYVATVVFVALCIAGVWMLTSSSITPSQALTRHSRSSFSSSSTPSRGLRKETTPAMEEEEEEDDDKEGAKSEKLETAAASGDEGEKDRKAGEKSGAASAIAAASGGGEEGGKGSEGGEGSTEAGEAGSNGERNQEERREEAGESEKERESKVEEGNLDGGVEEESQRRREEEEEEQRRHEEMQREHDEQLPTNAGEEAHQELQQEETQENSAGSEEKIEQVVNSDRREIEEESEKSNAEGDDNEGQVQSEEMTEEVGGKNRNGGDEEGQQQSEAERLPDSNGGDLEVRNERERDGENRPWATQADQSENEKERRKEEELQSDGGDGSVENAGGSFDLEWKMCNVSAGADYIPCLDNKKALKKIHSYRHYEHRERHCPEESPTCLVPLPKGYRRSIEWPQSRDRIWYNNVPYTKLAEVKGHQNWVKVTGEYLSFPGGGTQFIHGALHYIDFLQQSVHGLAWGKHTRVILDVGCGVASFGGYLFERDVLAMSFAPKDEHEAQVQFALERGIPAISAVMGSQRLPFPSKVFDLVHCARCRVPWHSDGGTLLLEINRVLRPGGFFIWSETPVYQKLEEDVQIWKVMMSITSSMCWNLVTIRKDRLNGIADAFYRKPTTNDCYKTRKHQNPPMCDEDDDPNAAWYIPLKTCLHRVPVDAPERGSRWPEEWPRRLRVPPFWLNSSQIGIYGKPAPDDFTADHEHWKQVVTKSYLSGFGINWSKVRNVMDMRAIYGGFAAALKDLKVWVMNVVNIDAPDTLPIIYERGLFGIYHDWCESFSTYPRTYDLLHADHLFSNIKKRCAIVPIVVEVDRIVRPGGKIIIRDESATVSEVADILKSLHWEVQLTFSKDQEGIICAEKGDWRPEQFAERS